ncbi:MAG: hypothetical protein RRA94_06210, partial [Bacteroidota bacterium]|nr:hypothetical protein [Bacteroidota bacterium]
QIGIYLYPSSVKHHFHLPVSREQYRETRSRKGDCRYSNTIRLEHMKTAFRMTHRMHGALNHLS